MKPNKACPVVLRRQHGIVEILAFAHPLAGLQLVKGNIEPNETPAQAAVRELAEEAGITNAHVIDDLGVWESGYQGQVWSFHLCEVSQPLPDYWSFHTVDDGGHDFAFFWHPLEQVADECWHELFRGALFFLQRAVLG